MTQLMIVTNMHVGLALIAVFFVLGLYPGRNKDKDKQLDGLD